MKGIIYTVLVLLLLAVVGVVTCPDKQAHYDEIEQVLREVVNEELNGSAESEEDMSILGEWLSSSSVKLVLNQSLSVDNYFVCSVGKVTFDGEVYPISVGVFNHVFTPSKEKIRTQLNESLDSLFE